VTIKENPMSEQHDERLHDTGPNAEEQNRQNAPRPSAAESGGQPSWTDSDSTRPAREAAETRTAREAAGPGQRDRESGADDRRGRERRDDDRRGGDLRGSDRRGGDLSSSDRRGGRPGPDTRQDAGARRSGPLLPQGESDKFALRLQQAVAVFVDEPRHAVEEIDTILEEVSVQFTEGLNDRRSTLHAAWSGKESETGTEDLRGVLRQYRDLVEQMLRI
jgi:hypothetical protein